MTNKLLSLTFLAPLVISTTVFANSNSVLGVEIGDDKVQVQQALQAKCNSLTIKSAHQVSFPLAKQSELHVVCEAVKSGGKAAVILADDKVVHVYATGLANSEITQVEGENKQYLDYQISSDHTLWRNAKTDSVTLLSHKGLHPNLFVWENFYLNVDREEIKPVTLNEGLPTFLRYGASIEELKSELESQCHPMQVQESNPWLPNKPKQQTQVNCFNVNYLGFPRKMELVFGDDKLELVWILSAEEEEKRIRDQLVGHFGLASSINDKWETFNGGKVYLRKDKPEVLAVSDALVKHYRSANNK